MHGLILAAFQTFFVAMYGQERWENIQCMSGLPSRDLDTMLVYESDLAVAVFEAAAAELGLGVDDMLEDLGTYLVSHEKMDGFRRLLRFSGVDYVDFLFSLEELPERTRLAVPDLILPALEIQEKTPGNYVLECKPGLAGYGSVLLGILRAMADDYGALVMLEHLGKRNSCDLLSITLIENAFADGKDFNFRASA